MNLSSHGTFLCLLYTKTYERLRKTISDTLTHCIFRDSLQI